MASHAFPARADVTICFAHKAYRFAEAFTRREPDISHFQCWKRDEFMERAGEADVIVTSGFWNNEILETTSRLRFVQSASAGIDQYDRETFATRSVLLASAQGANERAVSQHAMALILGLARHIHISRDDQRSVNWRGMTSNPAKREDELGGKTMLIVGMGRIGSRLAHLARAFGIHVIATKRDPSTAGDAANEIHAQANILDLLPKADIVVLTCPLTPETQGMINTQALKAMKPTAHLINVSRGKVVDEAALIEALEQGGINAAGLDCTEEEPLPASSKLWGMENVIITPHTAGETRRYEDNVIDLLMENLERLWRGESDLKNQVV
jgi:phosphoglycerate dehydrogenase-like enzyme